VKAVAQVPTAAPTHVFQLLHCTFSQKQSDVGEDKRKMAERALEKGLGDLPGKIELQTLSGFTFVQLSCHCFRKTICSGSYRKSTKNKLNKQLSQVCFLLTSRPCFPNF